MLDFFTADLNPSECKNNWLSNGTNLHVTIQYFSRTILGKILSSKKNKYFLTKTKKKVISIMSFVFYGYCYIFQVN